MERIMECVPNYSEGRNSHIIEKILDAFRSKENVKLLDFSPDKDHNRMVVTVIGEPEALRDAVTESVGIAVSLIDMTKHEGQHPRMGCIDVIPFIPIKGCTAEDADRIAKETAATAAKRFGQPFFLYEDSATAPHRKNLEDIRRGQFEGMTEKMKDPLWKPDYGPETIHPTGGVTAIGTRPPLIAFNVNLDTAKQEIASEIAVKIRRTGGGLRYCKALGVMLEDRNIAQVSINMTDYTKTAVYRIFEMVKMEARRFGVNVIGSEVVGLIPLRALVDCAGYYLQLEDFSIDQILESGL